MNDIVRFILDCVDWALTFDQRFRTLRTDAEQNYALIKSGIGDVVIFVMALPLIVLTNRFLRKLDERKKKKHKRNRQ